MIKNSSYDSINELTFDEKKLICEDWELVFAYHLKGIPSSPIPDAYGPFSAFDSQVPLNVSDHPLSEACDNSPGQIPNEIWEKWNAIIEQDIFFSHSETPVTSHSSPEKIIQQKQRRNSRKEGSNSEAKKKPQNPLKNFPGLICQHVKTLSKEDNEQGFFNQVVQEKGLFLNELAAFKEFIDQYKKDAKTWKTINAFLQTDLMFAAGFFELVYSFLSPKYSREFKRWLDEGKMYEKQRKTLEANVDKMKKKFEKAEEELGIVRFSVHGQKRVKLN